MLKQFFKSSFTIIGLIAIFFTMNGLSFADTVQDGIVEPLKEGTFNVRDTLSTKTQDARASSTADQGYFTDSANPPVVAFILRILDFATLIMGSVAIIIFIIAGFMFMTAQGNDQVLGEAKEVIRYAAIGLVVTFLSYIIILFVQGIFNVPVA